MDPISTDLRQFEQEDSSDFLCANLHDSTRPGRFLRTWLLPIRFAHFPPAGQAKLERLEVEVENGVSTAERYGNLYHRVAGKLEKVREAAKCAGLRWFRQADREACAGVYRVA